MENKYNVDDEVYWNDPDEGLCSKHGNVKEVLLSNGDSTIYRLVDADGNDFEAFQHELS